MAKDLKAGDKVGWDSSGGHSMGKVEKKLTSPMKIKGHEVAASPDNPEFGEWLDCRGVGDRHRLEPRVCRDIGAKSVWPGQYPDQDEADDRRDPQPRERRDDDPRRAEDGQRVAQGGGHVEVAGHGS